MNANSGYVGWSRSRNAALAEREGRLPLTRAVAYLAAEAGIRRADARALLLAEGPCEWHHTSKKFNRTDYYDAAGLAERVRAAPALPRLLAADPHWIDTVLTAADHARAVVIRRIDPNPGILSGCEILARYGAGIAAECAAEWDAGIDAALRALALAAGVSEADARAAWETA
jgi:hypothetical protein